MKLHPILFSTEMVNAILDDRKIMTRRMVKKPLIKHNDVIKIPLPIDEYAIELKKWQDKGYKTIGTDGSIAGYLLPECPYGHPGDVLWVRESFFAYGHWSTITENGKKKKRFHDLTIEQDNQYYYENNMPYKICKYGELGYHKRPSLFMPKAACRLFLQIENIRVERLQEITPQDAINEGIEIGYCADDITGKDLVTYKNYLTGTHLIINECASFMTLWQSINGEESWNANPFVWIITFKKINKLNNFLP